MSGLPVLLLLLGAGLWGCEAFTAQQRVYPGQDELFELSIIHLNDFHARFVQTSYTSGTCHKGREADCIGGLGRIVTATRDLLEERPNAIFLNAGDHYQGTLWYNVHKWNATSYFMNKLPHDVMTIGNHDFDDGIEGLIPFLERANKPIVVTNIDDSEEPSIQGYYKNSTVIKRGNQTIGVIGVILQSTNTLSSTGKLRFLDEVKSVNAEAARLKASGIDIIIVLSHCGLNVDRVMAANCPEIDVIVGGHSHTFLYSGKPPFIDDPEDEYPVVVKQDKNDRTVLIVQAAAFTKYLGNLTVWFDSRGEVADWEGNPILLDNSIEQDPAIQAELEPWAEVVERIGNEVVGETKTFLNSTCYVGECNLANVITDAMVYAYRAKAESPNHWTYAAISCMNAGGVRNSIPEGIITYGDVATVQPFENTWDVVDILGSDLYDVLEESVAKSSQKERFVGVGFLHWSGIRVAYNLTAPAFSRIVDLHIRCQACPIPEYKPLNPMEWYRVIVPTFVLNGGDNIQTIFKKHRNRRSGELDINLLINYIKNVSPLEYVNDQRLQLLGKWQGQ